MAPGALKNGTQPVQLVSQLTKSGMEAAQSQIDQTSALSQLDSSSLQITRSKDLRAIPGPNSPEFLSCSYCTDHMVTARWTVGGGWDAPQIKPYGGFTIMPPASCLHYATQAFEGMKAYRGYDGKVRLFRPDRNCERLVMSSTRVALPSFDPVELRKLIKALMKVDAARWLPKSQPGQFLYLRPTIIGTGLQLGIELPNEALLFIIAVQWPDISPPTGGLKLLASREDMTRAWPGGFGNAKVGANYGPSFVAHGEAKAQGFDQILWLFGADCKVTEAGASNFFVIWKNKDTGKKELATAPLTDKIILEGVTRRSVLDLARERLAVGSDRLPEHMDAVDVVERTFTMYEVEDAHKEGRIIEAFVSGTAFFITAVSTISFRGQDLPIPTDSKSGQYAATFKRWLKDIMYGNEPHAWGDVVEGVENES